MEWGLSFPKAPLGSVSINVWSVACGSVISLVSEALLASIALAVKKPDENKKAQPVGVGAGGAKAASTPVSGKKEL